LVQNDRYTEIIQEDRGGKGVGSRKLFWVDNHRIGICKKGGGRERRVGLNNMGKGGQIGPLEGGYVLG